MFCVWMILPNFTEFCETSHAEIHIGSNATAVVGMVKVGAVKLSGFGILNSSFRAYDDSEVVVTAFKYLYQAGTLMEFVTVECLAIIMACGKRAQPSSVTHCEKE